MKDSEIEDIKARMLETLETVIDPELGIDVVNLGLIYELEFDTAGKATIKMTLTTMGCPLGDILSDEIKRVLAELPEVKEVEVQLVWSPQWSPEKMSRYARIALGISS